MADLPRLERRPEARIFSVETLLQYVQEGRIRVPGFARNLRWGSSDVLAFFDSLYRGIPVGNLLFARQPADAGTLYFGPVQVRAPGVSDALFVVDGQQRLTAIAAALLHPDPHPRGDIYALWFDLEAQTFRRLDAPEAPLHWVPLNVLANPVRLLGWLRAWPLNAERADLAERAIDLSTALKQYPLPAYLVEGASGDSVRRMFMRINTSGVPLREVDVLEALLTAGEPRPIAAARLRLEETGFGLLTEEVFIHCLKAVEHWDLHQDTFRAEAVLVPEALERTEDALRRAITFLTTEAGVPHVQLLPFWLPLVILARFFHLTPNPSPRTRLLLSRWVWRGMLADAFKLPDTGYQSGVLSGISGDPHTSVEHLLAGVPRTPRYPTASTKWSPLHAPARLCAIALFHMGPRDPETGAVLDLHALQDLLARKDLKQVFLDVGHSPPSTVARHVFLSDAGKLPLLPGAPLDVLQSHGLDEVAADALRKQDLDTFEQRRTQLLDAWCERFFRERTAPDESDRPPITELLRRVDERASTPGLTLPVEGQTGSWIAKFHDPNYRDLPRVEFATMLWARASGIPVPPLRLGATSEFTLLPEGIPTGDGTVYLIERFDRTPQGGRVHIEDMGQVLDKPPGTPQYSGRYEHIAAILAALAREDLRDYCERLVFCVLCGNTDAHLKNWSLIYPDGRHPRLSPAYDLVASVLYSPPLEDALALELGGSRRFESIRAESFQLFADVTGLTFEEVSTWVRQAVERIRTAWREKAAELPYLPRERTRLEAHMARVPLAAD